MGHCYEFDDALWATAMNLIMRYGHCDEFSFALWATAANLAIRYGPLCGIKPYNKNL